MQSSVSHHAKLTVASAPRTQSVPEGRWAGGGLEKWPSYLKTNKTRNTHEGIEGESHQNLDGGGGGEIMCVVIIVDHLLIQYD